MCRADPPVLPWVARVESSTLAFPTITTIVICVDLSTQRHERAAWSSQSVSQLFHGPRDMRAQRRPMLTYSPSEVSYRDKGAAPPMCKSARREFRESAFAAPPSDLAAAVCQVVYHPKNPESLHGHARETPQLGMHATVPIRVPARLWGDRDHPALIALQAARGAFFEHVLRVCIEGGAHLRSDVVQVFGPDLRRRLTQNEGRHSLGQTSRERTVAWQRRRGGRRMRRSA